MPRWSTALLPSRSPRHCPSEDFADDPTACFQLGPAATSQPRHRRFSHRVHPRPRNLFLRFPNCLSAGRCASSATRARESNQFEFGRGSHVTALDRRRRSCARFEHTTATGGESVRAAEDSTRAILLRRRTGVEGTATVDCRSSAAELATAGPGVDSASSSHTANRCCPD